jgi:predicted kinase
MREDSHEEESETDIGERTEAEALEIGRKLVQRRSKRAERKREVLPVRRTLPKTLLIIAGHEGAGKSRITDGLEAHLPLVVIDKDPLSNTFSSARGEHDDPVHKAMRPIVYKTMYALAEETLREGGSAVLDAPFNKYEDFFHNEAWVTEIRRIAEATGATVKVIWCTASPETKFKRMKKRNAPQDRRRTDEELMQIANRTDEPMIGFDSVSHDTEEGAPKDLYGFLGVSEEVHTGALTHIPLESTIGGATTD